MCMHMGLDPPFNKVPHHY